MDSTERRISKLKDYSRVCLSTLGNAGLTLALLKPLIEDVDLRTNYVEAEAVVAHQHLANILFGSFLTEAISITEGGVRTQASLSKIRHAIASQDVILKLETFWRDEDRIILEDSDTLPDEAHLKAVWRRDAQRGLEHFRELKSSMQANYDDLIESSLYKKSKTARDKILAHKDTWRCPASSTWRAEWFDRIGLSYPDAWSLYERLGDVSKTCNLLLTRTSYALGFLDEQSTSIATKFWYNK